MSDPQKLAQQRRDLETLPPEPQAGSAQAKPPSFFPTCADCDHAGRTDVLGHFKSQAHYAEAVKLCRCRGGGRVCQFTDVELLSMAGLLTPMFEGGKGRTEISTATSHEAALMLRTAAYIQSRLREVEQERDAEVAKREQAVRAAYKAGRAGVAAELDVYQGNGLNDLIADLMRERDEAREIARRHAGCSCSPRDMFGRKHEAHCLQTTIASWPLPSSGKG